MFNKVIFTAQNTFDTVGYSKSIKSFIGDKYSVQQLETYLIFQCQTASTNKLVNPK